MAITKAFRIRLHAVADGTSTSLILNLMHDPYMIGAQSPTGVGARTLNWFADPGSSGTPKPVGVKVIEGATNATLNTTNWDVTITLPVKPAGSFYTITMDLYF